MITRREGKKSVSYQVRVTGNDGKDITNTFKIRKDAERFEAELKNKKLNGEVLLASLRNLSLDDYYWKHWCVLSRLNVSLGWKKTQDQMYRDYISPVIGNLKVISSRSCTSGTTTALYSV